MQEIFNVFILAIIQGIAEFLPISSSAHLQLIANLLNFEELSEIKFFLELGTFLATLFYFLSLILGNLAGILKLERHSSMFFTKIFVSILPFAFFFPFVKNYSGSMGLFLILGSILMIFAEIIYFLQKKQKVLFIENISFTQSFIVGIFQVFSIFSGFSRSGATICGGLICNFSRSLAVRFSFLISLPLTFCSLCYEFYRLPNFTILGIFGFLISFLTAIFFIRIALKFLSIKTLLWFAFYRLILGFSMLLI